MQLDYLCFQNNNHRPAASVAGVTFW
jgi:hypothetical protein